MTALDEHMANIIATTSYFESRLEAIDSRLQTLFQRVRISGDGDNDNNCKEYDRLRDEKESAKQCIAICVEASRNASRRLHEQPRAEAGGKDKDATFELQQGLKDKKSKQERAQIEPHQATGKAHTHVFEDVLAADGSCQIIAVASEDLLSAVRVTAGAGATQWLGHLSCSTLEELLQDRKKVHGAQQKGRKVMGL
ncbi:hypothetical protein WAI453_012696 [Rhynchosporium graminicola]